MTKDELTEARKPENVDKLLTQVSAYTTTDYQKTAYNFLIEYLECPEWFESHEGGRVVLLSLEVLHGIQIPLRQGSEIHPNKRDKRRLEREKEKGPERLIVSTLGHPHTPDLYVLECQHEVHNPKVQQTTHMKPPKHYRCLQCKEITDGHNDPDSGSEEVRREDGQG